MIIKTVEKILTDFQRYFSSFWQEKELILRKSNML